MVELGVDQNPSVFETVPVFGDPMVDEHTFFEVGAEAAAGAGRHTLVAQHRDMHQREVATDTDVALTGGTGSGERAWIVVRDTLQHTFD